MNKFLALLSLWRGRSFVQRELESRGFMIPTRYQELVAGYCSPESRRGLDTYWDEAAREYVCSAGQVNSITRTFPDVKCYRSKYLDDLASNRDDLASIKNASSRLKIPPLHPCLIEFEVARRSDPDLDARMVEDLQNQKHVEICSHGIRRESWTWDKKDVLPLFGNLMMTKGFKKWKKSFIKASPSGLVFGAFADVGGRPYCIAVPLTLFIAWESDMVEMFEISPDRVIAGFWFYYGINSIENGILGFRAYVELIDIMAGSFCE